LRFKLSCASSSFWFEVASSVRFKLCASSSLALQAPFGSEFQALCASSFALQALLRFKLLLVRSFKLRALQALRFKLSCASSSFWFGVLSSVRFKLCAVRFKLSCSLARLTRWVYTTNVLRAPRVRNRVRDCGSTFLFSCIGRLGRLGLQDDIASIFQACCRERLQEITRSCSQE
jgi:hypothetical protein